jgi:hypothetical protein
MAVDELTLLKQNNFRTGVGTMIEDYKRIVDQGATDLMSIKNRCSALYGAIDGLGFDTETTTRIKAQLVANATLARDSLVLLAGLPTIVDTTKAAAENPEAFATFPS